MTLLDLTHKFMAGIPHSTLVPGVTVEQVMDTRTGICNVSLCSFSTHVGTHIDSPRHFFDDGPGVDELPLTTLCGTASLLRVDAELTGPISGQDREDAGKHVRRGDRLFIDTGFSPTFVDGDILRHPYLEPDAAEWLLEREVAVVVLDTLSPEVPNFMRDDRTFEHPIHRMLLSAGTLIVENANMLPELPERFDVHILPLPLVGGDGAPVRIAATVP